MGGQVEEPVPSQGPEQASQGVDTGLYPLHDDREGPRGRLQLHHREAVRRDIRVHWGSDDRYDLPRPLP